MKIKIGEWEGFTAYDFPSHLTTDECAARANALLADKLEGAQQVWKTEFDVRPAWTEFQSGTEKKTARLVCIEEIEK